MNRNTVFAALTFNVAVACPGFSADARAENLNRTRVGATETGAPAATLPRPGKAASAAGVANATSASGAMAKEVCEDGAVAPAVVRELILAEAVRQSADAKLALAIAAQESRFGAQVNSKAAAASGARGVMQLMPETAARYGVANRCDVAENVRGGVALIKELSTRFGGNVFLVLAAYNAGERRVYAAGGVPPNAETVRYVAAVANAYYDFSNALNPARRGLADGAEAPAAGPSGLTADAAGQTWIGGSVLYVEQEK